jgi:hypothetical protein
MVYILLRLARSLAIGRNIKKKRISQMNTLTSQDLEQAFNECVNATDYQPDMILCSVETWRYVVNGWLEAFQEYVDKINKKIARCDPDNHRRIAVFKAMIEDIEKEIKIGKEQIRKSYMPKDRKV